MRQGQELPGERWHYNTRLKRRYRDAGLTLRVFPVQQAAGPREFAANPAYDAQGPRVKPGDEDEWKRK